jgi:hypothetical protein
MPAEPQAAPRLHGCRAYLLHRTTAWRNNGRQNDGFPDDSLEKHRKPVAEKAVLLITMGLNPSAARHAMRFARRWAQAKRAGANGAISIEAGRPATRSATTLPVIGAAVMPTWPWPKA